MIQVENLEGMKGRKECQGTGGRGWREGVEGSSKKTMVLRKRQITSNTRLDTRLSVEFLMSI